MQPTQYTVKSEEQIYVPLSVNADDDKANRENCASFLHCDHLHISTQIVHEEQSSFF